MATQDYSKLTHPIVVLIRGLPGSGKSYLAESLTNYIGKNSVVALDPDAIDYDSQAYADHVKAATADGIDPKLFPYRFLRAQAYQGIANHKIVIWNQPFTDLEIFNKMIGRLEDCASENNTKLAILVVEVNVDPATAKARVEERKKSGGHGPSDSVFARFVREYTTAADRGYQVVTVRGNTDVSASVATIMQPLSKLANR